MTRVGTSTYPELPASEWDDCNDTECAEEDGTGRQEPREDVRRREDEDRQGDSQTDHEARHCGRYQRLREQRHLIAVEMAMDLEHHTSLWILPASTRIMTSWY